MHAPGHGCRGCGRPRGFSGQHRNSRKPRQRGEKRENPQTWNVLVCKGGCGNRNFRTGMGEAGKATALLRVLAAVPGVWRAWLFTSQPGSCSKRRGGTSQLGVEVATGVSEVMFGGLSECSTCPPHPHLPHPPALQGPIGAWGQVSLFQLQDATRSSVPPPWELTDLGQLPIFGGTVGPGGGEGAAGVPE